MMNLGAVSYGLGALLYLALSLLLVFGWRGRGQAAGAILILTSVVSVFWCAALAYQAADRGLSQGLLQGLEVVRNLFWFVFFLKALGYVDAGGRERAGTVWLMAIALFVLSALMLFYLAVVHRYLAHIGADVLRVQILLFGHVLLAVGGLLLVEQLYRNTRLEQRWAIKFLCLGVGASFAYDFYLYADGLLFNKLDLSLWNSRGAINAMVVPLIAMSVARNRSWSLDIFVSRKIVFHSATLLGAGIYLLVMAGAGYYIRDFGGSWGGLIQVVFLFGAGIVLFLLMFSGQVRARLKAFVSEHFYDYKYDYREEWLRFTNTLSVSSGDTDLRQVALKAIAEIVESRGAMLWLYDGREHYVPAGNWEMQEPGTAIEPVSSPFVHYLATHSDPVDLRLFVLEPESYEGLELPDWLRDWDAAWLVLPLRHRQHLLGFLALASSRVPRELNREDLDLIATVSYQAASYLALRQVSEELADARQFEAFNRLSAYVVHDLKNLVAQLSLVVSNAERHKDNPAFMEDAIGTVGNAVAKMNRLLAQLRKGRQEAHGAQKVDVGALLREAVESKSGADPRPLLGPCEAGLMVVAHRDRLTAVLEHIIQNAQDATSEQGRIEARLSRDGERAVVEVEDNGSGMDSDFVRDRLFRPFVTTKGNAGMGVGAYESREFVRSLGGDILVRSEPGAGTVFEISLPLAVEV